MVRRSQESQPFLAVLSEVADTSSESGARGKFTKESASINKKRCILRYSQKQ